MSTAQRLNANQEVIRHFGKEWSSFDNINRPWDDLQKEFNGYFSIFPWNKLSKDSEGFDAGCGSGRWAKLFLERLNVKKLNCIDPSSAIDVAKNQLKGFTNVEFFIRLIDDMPLKDNSQDFGYCLGVLHHIPDTEGAMRKCVDKLKSGAPFLVYMYYNFENRPWWFRGIWRISDLMRRCICHLPHKLKILVTNLIAMFVYWPLARFALILEKLHLPYKNVLLSAYRYGAFYNMKNCALDRFGTCLEKRYSKSDIVCLMTKCGLKDISFSDDPDVNWVAIGYKI